MCGHHPVPEFPVRPIPSFVRAATILILTLLNVASAAPNRQSLGQSPTNEFTSRIGMKFVWIPPGTFLMGSPNNELSRGGNEQQHQVTLSKGFFMAIYTVTQEEWQTVMGNNPSQFRGEKNLPVEKVSWHDAHAFMQKLRAIDGKPYRLPTEAEWEYACRAGTTTPFHTGETISTDQANFNGSTVYGNGKPGVNRQKTTPVGTFPPNGFGLFDMHGNVTQWVQDPHPQQPNIKVLRGGCFIYGPAGVRTAHRDGIAPDSRNHFIGFRICFSNE